MGFVKIAILTMFTGLSSTYSLVNVVADQIDMLLRAGVSVKVLVSELCPDGERTGVFSDSRVEWIKITNTCGGKTITWHDYSGSGGAVHPFFFQEAKCIGEDFVRHLEDVDVCILHDILYQGWYLVHNIAIRMAQERLPKLRFLAFTHSLPQTRPEKLEFPFSARFTGMPRTRFAIHLQSVTSIFVKTARKDESSGLQA